MNNKDKTWKEELGQIIEDACGRDECKFSLPCSHTSGLGTKLVAFMDATLSTYKSELVKKLHKHIHDTTVTVSADSPLKLQEVINLLDN